MIIQHQKGTVGVDIGGTSLKAGVVGPDGKSLSAQDQVIRVPSEVRSGPQATLIKIREVYSELCQMVSSQFPVGAVGIAVAGMASKDGIMEVSANFGDSWRGVAIRELLEKTLELPTAFENDANAAGLAESAFLRRSSAPSTEVGPVVVITIGTGLGGAFVDEKGELMRGNRGQAAELGHIPMGRVAKSSLGAAMWDMRCGCGRLGCSELFTSRAFLRQELIARRNEDDTNILYKSGDIEKAVDMLPSEAEKGNRFARSILEMQAFNAGVLLGHMIIIFDPGYMVIGGGVSQSTDTVKNWFMENVLKGIRAENGRGLSPSTKVIFANLGNNAGWIGAGISAGQLLGEAR